MFSWQYFTLILNNEFRYTAKWVCNCATLIAWYISSSSSILLDLGIKPLVLLELSYTKIFHTDGHYRLAGFQMNPIIWWNINACNTSRVFLPLVFFTVFCVDLSHKIPVFYVWFVNLFSKLLSLEFFPRYCMRGTCVLSASFSVNHLKFKVPLPVLRHLNISLTRYTSECLLGHRCG